MQLYTQQWTAANDYHNDQRGQLSMFNYRILRILTQKCIPCKNSRQTLKNSGQVSKFTASVNSWFSSSPNHQHLKGSNMLLLLLSVSELWANACSLQSTKPQSTISCFILRLHDEAIQNTRADHVLQVCFTSAPRFCFMFASLCKQGMKGQHNYNSNNALDRPQQMQQHSQQQQQTKHTSNNINQHCKLYLPPAQWHETCTQTDEQTDRQTRKQTGIGMLPITTSTSDELLSHINIDDFEKPQTSKMKVFIDFFAMHRVVQKKWHKVYGTIILQPYITAFSKIIGRKLLVQWWNGK